MENPIKFYDLDKLVKVFTSFRDNTVADRFFISEVDVNYLIKKAEINTKDKNG